MKNARDFLIVTNNPLLAQCMGDCYELSFFPDCSYREILVKVRDLVYVGHTLYTHPLSGSVKPNETPYKSIAVSKAPHAFSAEQAGIIAECILAADKFPPRTRALSEAVKRDFQLIDSTLLAGALEFDAAAGLSKIKNHE